MPPEPASSSRGVEPQRADARPNRAALLRSAATLFADQGPDVALDAVARSAGVSIATLYRNFPNREALVSETYRNEIEQLGDVAPLLAGHGTADDALATWLTNYVEHARTKRALSELIHALPADSRPAARDAIVGALDRLLSAGHRDGTLRQDLDAEDVLAALAGLWSLPESPDWLDRAHRLTRFVLDGLRRSPSATP